MYCGAFRSTFRKVIACELEDRSNPEQDKDLSLCCHYQTDSQTYFVAAQLVLMSKTEAADSLIQSRG